MCNSNLNFQKLIQANKLLTFDDVNEALQQLKGAVMIVYPMGLPPYDPIELEFRNQEELEGTQVNIFYLQTSNIDHVFNRNSFRTVLT